LAELLAHAVGPAPRGWVRLAGAAPDVDGDTLDGLYARGVSAGEAGAREALGTRRRQAGWAAYRAGDDDAARRLLREAKALLA
ncbi:MAG: hypothetical protein AAF447_27870, partial [Myxococcota bacterium]